MYKECSKGVDGMSTGSFFGLFGFVSECQIAVDVAAVIVQGTHIAQNGENSRPSVHGFPGGKANGAFKNQGDVFFFIDQRFNQRFAQLGQGIIPQKAFAQFVALTKDIVPVLEQQPLCRF